MYAAEVAVDTGLGICVLALYLSLLEKAITMEFMVHSDMGAPGMFYVLGGITLVGAVFIQCYIKETRGLTDVEKKQLFMPLDCIEEERKAGESALSTPATSAKVDNSKVAPEDLDKGEKNQV